MLTIRLSHQEKPKKDGVPNAHPAPGCIDRHPSQSLLAGPAIAAVATGNMTVRITITAECKVQTANDLDFGSKGVIDSNFDQTSTIGVQCTSGQTYNVGLSAGAGAGATVAVRKMTGPDAATVNYTLYRDTARTQPWG